MIVKSIKDISNFGAEVEFKTYDDFLYKYLKWSTNLFYSSRYELEHFRFKDTLEYVGWIESDIKESIYDESYIYPPDLKRYIRAPKDIFEK